MGVADIAGQSKEGLTMIDENNPLSDEELRDELQKFKESDPIGFEILKANLNAHFEGKN